MDILVKTILIAGLIYLLSVAVRITYFGFKTVFFRKAMAGENFFLVKAIGIFLIAGGAFYIARYMKYIAAIDSVSFQLTSLFTL